jgi:dUTPase
MKLLIKINNEYLKESYQLNQKNHESDSGFDLIVPETVTIPGRKHCSHFPDPRNLPNGWGVVPSRSRPGLVAFVNTHTGERISWIPQEPASTVIGSILKKKRPKEIKPTKKLETSEIGAEIVGAEIVGARSMSAILSREKEDDVPAEVVIKEVYEPVIYKPYILDLQVHGNMVGNQYLTDSKPYMVFPRSSMGSKTPLRLANSIGLIDKDYRGSLKLIIDNISDQDYTVERGTRLVQIVSFNGEPFDVDIVNELSETVRGSGGLGSTGI